MSFFKTWLSGESNVDPNFSEDLRAVEEVMSQLPTREGRLYAAVALLYGQVVYVDREISEGEKERLISVFETQWGVEKKLSQAIAEIALERVQELNVEEHIVIRQIRELASPEEKRKILRSAFFIAADEDISTVENETIRNLSISLGFSQKEFVEVRSEFREHLSSLKNLPK